MSFLSGTITIYFVSTLPLIILWVDSKVVIKVWPSSVSLSAAVIHHVRCPTGSTTSNKNMAFKCLELFSLFSLPSWKLSHLTWCLTSCRYCEYYYTHLSCIYPTAAIHILLHDTTGVKLIFNTGQLPSGGPVDTVKPHKFIITQDTGCPSLLYVLRLSDNQSGVPKASFYCSQPSLGILLC